MRATRSRSLKNADRARLPRSLTAARHDHAVDRRPASILPTQGRAGTGQVRPDSAAARVARHLPGPTKESKMGAPSSELCNPLAEFSVENRLELPAGEVIACSPAVSVAGRAKFASRAPLPCTAVAVTLLSLLAASAGAATAQELSQKLSIDQPVIAASDPVSQQPAEGKPADHPNPPERGASEATASGFDAATLPPMSLNCACAPAVTRPFAS